MSERINKLIGSALDKAVPYTWTTLDYDQATKVMNVLAQLIVEECMKQCQHIRDDALVQKESAFLTESGKMLYEGVYGGANNCGFAIQQHFGV